MSTPKRTFTPPEKLTSARIVEGMDRTPHRAFLRASRVASGGLYAAQPNCQLGITSI